MKNNNSSIFVIVISLFIIVFIIIAYFVVSGSMFKNSALDPNDNSNSNSNSNSNDNCADNIDTCSNDVSFLDEGLVNHIDNSNNSNNSTISDGEVFHLRDNIYNYHNAKAACRAYNSRLATLKEVIDSYKNGANWCNYGWSHGQLALYPIQTKYWEKLQENNNTKYQCGDPGVNGGYFHNKHYEIGANCFGRRPLKSHKSKLIPNYSELPDELDIRAKEYKKLIDDGEIKVSPFSDTSWHK